MNLAGSVTVADRQRGRPWKWIHDELIEREKGPGYRTIQSDGLKDTVLRCRDSSLKAACSGHLVSIIL